MHRILRVGACIMAEFFIADNHFNHLNIIEYCARPFKSVEEMDKEMIERWNSVVGPSDTVYHGGDFCFLDINEEGESNAQKHLKTVSRYLSPLNGKKILIKGNHDPNSRSGLIQAGFESVFTSLQIGEIFMTHKPSLNLANECFNVHGHIHNIPLRSSQKYPVKDVSKYFCISAEAIDYYPISYEQLMDIMGRRSA